MKKKDHELISVEDCIDELIYGTGQSVIWHEVNGKRMSDEEYAAMIREEYAADPPAGYSAGACGKERNDHFLCRRRRPPDICGASGHRR